MFTEEQIRKDFAQRLELASKKKGLPDKGKGILIANELKISAKAVSKWFNAETMPSTANIYSLATFLDVTPEWLNYGDSSEFTPNVTKAHLKEAYSYPIISAIQAGVWTEACDFADSEGYTFIDSEIDAGEQGFFLRINGLSMEPKFSEGDLVLIDIRKRPHPGDFVAAVNGNGEATLKRYRELGDISPSGNPYFELVPLNPDFPTLSSKTQDIRIIGVAVEHRSYL